MNGNEEMLRLLIVDDEEEFLASSAQALSRRGFQVHTARDGSAALDIVEQHDIDVIVLDLRMPGMDGEEVFDRLRKDHPSTPVIMLTGHGSIPHAFKTSKKGIADYIAKPCDIDELADRVRKAACLAADRAKSFNDAGTAGLASMIEVLLVDDEVDFLSSMKNTLQRRTMNVTVAESAEQALYCLKTGPIEVAVVDVKMPGMDGLGLLKIIREDFPNVKVILLSGHPSTSAALEGIRLGAGDYLAKPPDVDVLAATIRRLRSQRAEDVAEQEKKLMEEIRSRFEDVAEQQKKLIDEIRDKLTD